MISVSVVNSKREADGLTIMIQAKLALPEVLCDGRMMQYGEDG